MRTERTHEELQQAANEYLNAEGYESELDLLQEMLEYAERYGTCDALDYCSVETDGTCPHGYPSWLVYLGVI